MKIHTNSLDEGQLHEAMVQFSDVELFITGHPGSRSHHHAFEVALRGNGDRHKRSPNTGIKGGDSRERAATYDDWGYFIAALYSFDPEAIVGPYTGIGDFRRKTNGKYTY